MKNVAFEFKLKFTSEYPEEDVYVEDVRADVGALLQGILAEANSLGMTYVSSKYKWFSDKGFKSERHAESLSEPAVVTGEEKK